jgi:hypothetical protein|tara:strand:- start:273 stop:539 length:267 start_codon:yes stop_codon:yes gene_type:complete
VSKNNDLKSLIERLSSFYTGAVYDVLRDMGITNTVLPKEIRPLDASKKLAGPVWTCSGEIDEKSSADESLISWTSLLGSVPAEYVLVC